MVWYVLTSRKQKITIGFDSKYAMIPSSFEPPIVTLTPHHPNNVGAEGVKISVSLG